MDIKVPSVGESISEGTIARWVKKDGEAVAQGDTLFELETEKATTEVPSPVGGVLHIRVPEGKTVAIGAVVGSVEEGASAPAKTKSVAAKPQAPETSPPISPAARRMATEEKISPAAIAGSGRGGLITKEDVLHHLENKQKPAAPPPPSETPASPVSSSSEPAGNQETRQTMSAIRQRIADRLLASQKGTATLTTFNEADLSAVMDLRARFKERFHARHGINLGFMGFFVKAVVEALRAYPVVNASIDQADIVYHHDHHIGVAVSTDKGLMVPVVRDAGHLSFAAIEKTVADLADKARSGKITVRDLQGGTFTITNGGVFGSLLSTPILNPPQSAILGMHTIQKRPVVVNDQIAIRPMMYLALSYDHRLIDGREAVLFLVRVKECIEDPERMLLEV